MTSTLMQPIDPTTNFGPNGRGLLKYAVRAVWRRLARAGGTADLESRDFVIKQDLVHLDRNQLRDIGLDRNAL